jgi:hypothetical protein
MKMSYIAVHLTAGVSLALLSFGAGSVYAASATASQNVGDSFVQAGQFQPVKWEDARIEKLRHAYALLEKADADYKGHRVEAMHSVKKAAEVLGVELKWNGRGEESQWKSDRQLTEARRLLKEVADESGAKEQIHLHTAIKELDKALAVK